MTHIKALNYQTGVEFVLLGQKDLWGVGHDMDVCLFTLPGSNIRFLRTINRHRFFLEYNLTKEKENSANIL